MRERLLPLESLRVSIPSPGSGSRGTNRDPHRVAHPDVRDCGAGDTLVDRGGIHMQRAGDPGAPSARSPRRRARHSGSVPRAYQADGEPWRIVATRSRFGRLAFEALLALANAGQVRLAWKDRLSRRRPGVRVPYTPPSTRPESFPDWEGFRPLLLHPGRWIPRGYQTPRLPQRIPANSLRGGDGVGTPPVSKQP